MKTREPDAFIPLTPAVFHILLCLADSDRHGYAIMREVNSQSSGTVKLGPGTLYTAIRRLLDSGLIKESDERPDPELDDTRRRYYSLTSLGQRVMLAEIKRLGNLVRAGRATKLIRNLERT
jgi:DNA-binding PadR family transcriptional regulator